MEERLRRREVLSVAGLFTLREYFNFSKGLLVNGGSREKTKEEGDN